MTIQPFRFWYFLLEHYIRNSKKRKASFLNMRERMQPTTTTEDNFRINYLSKIIDTAIIS
jgi:hypothetical protein